MGVWVVEVGVWVVEMGVWVVDAGVWTDCGSVGDGSGGGVVAGIGREVGV